MQRNKVKGGTR